MPDKDQPERPKISNDEQELYRSLEPEVESLKVAELYDSLLKFKETIETKLDAEPLTRVSYFSPTSEDGSYFEVTVSMELNSDDERTLVDEIMGRQPPYREMSGESEDVMITLFDSDNVQIFSLSINEFNGLSEEGDYCLEDAIAQFEEIRDNPQQIPMSVADLLSSLNALSTEKRELARDEDLYDVIKYATAACLNYPHEAKRHIQHDEDRPDVKPFVYSFYATKILADNNFPGIYNDVYFNLDIYPDNQRRMYGIWVDDDDEINIDVFKVNKDGSSTQIASNSSDNYLEYVTALADLFLND